MRQLLLCLCAIVGLAQCVLIEWTADDYPNPQEDPVACGRYSGKPSYVCDPNGIISTEQADFLDHILLNLSNDTKSKCPCSAYACERKEHSKGYIMAIALIRKIHRPENTPDTVESKTALVDQFAFDLLRKKWNKWGSCDEVILIIFSKEDGILTTISGDTPLRVLTRSSSKAIMTEMSRFFRADGNIGQGLHYVVVNYRRVLDGYGHYPIMFTDVEVENTANVIKVSMITSLITTILLRMFC